MTATIYLKSGTSVFAKNVVSIKESFTETTEYKDFKNFIFRDGYFYTFIGENIVAINGVDILYVNFSN